MEYREVASKILGRSGRQRQRHERHDVPHASETHADEPGAVKSDELKEIKGVLGTVRRGRDGIEVVLGPASIEGVSREFSLQSGVGVSGPSMAPKSPMGALANAPEKNEAEDRQPGPKKQDHIVITPGRRSSYRAQQRAAINDERLGKEDMDALRAFLDEGTKAAASAKPEKGGKSVLVINGPNINMLGIREPSIYGKADYAVLVRTCKAAAAEAGFSGIRCFQSNHEGAIVDEIQSALGTYDGIVMNPAAYTHTSIGHPRRPEGGVPSLRGGSHLPASRTARTSARSHTCARPASRPSPAWGSRAIARPFSTSPRAWGCSVQALAVADSP